MLEKKIVETEHRRWSFIDGQVKDLLSELKIEKEFWNEVRAWGWLVLLEDIFCDPRVL